MRGIWQQEFILSMSMNSQIAVSLLKRPSVRALGEVILDRTVPDYERRKQKAVLERVLGYALPDQCLILHLRRTREDKYGLDVHARCLNSFNSYGIVILKIQLILYLHLSFLLNFCLIEHCDKRSRTKERLVLRLSTEHVHTF